MCPNSKLQFSTVMCVSNAVTQFQEGITCKSYVCKRIQEGDSELHNGVAQFRGRSLSCSWHVFGLDVQDAFEIRTCSLSLSL